MKLQVLLAGAAALALVAGGAHAATKKSAGNYAEPSQPIAYSKLDSYLKSSAHSRKTQDWTLGAQTAAAAAPGSAANASATAPTGMTQPPGGVTNDQQGASAPAPAAAAPNPPPTQDQPPAPQAAPAGSAPQ